MPPADRSRPMPVKHWSFAGLLMTYRCDARCASCYLCCGPERREEMTAEFALSVWEGLIRASPRGCRVHLSGGEPFLNWPLLIEVCRAARRAGLGPLHAVETNASWAVQPATVRRRLRALDEAGMQRLTISADPYHQQFVPIERPRLLAALAEEVLGPGRVQVRWRDWLADGCDLADLPAARQQEIMARYAARGRERLNGRAAESLAGRPELKPLDALADNPCSERLLRSRHVHVDPAGWIMPGTCAGILLGRCDGQEPREVWERLDAEHRDRPILGALAAAGPARLLPAARQAGLVPAERYAGKCHLCWDVRRWLAWAGLHGREIGPRWLYGQRPR